MLMYCKKPKGRIVEEGERLGRKLLQSSRPEMTVTWNRVVVLEVVRGSQMMDIF